MKISIVTAVYNNKNTIADAIASVQSQSYPNIEHVIQDGGSTDGTLDIIEEMSNSCTFLESRSDYGIYNAINSGIARTNGDVVALLHSDDFYSSAHVIEKVVSVFENSNIDGLYGDLHYVSCRDPSRVVRHWIAGDYSKSKVRRGWMPPHPTVFLRRDVFEKYGMYDESYEISGDYDAMLRYFGIHHLRMAYIPEVLVKMRTGGESNKSLRHVWRKSCEDYRALRYNKIGGVLTLMLKNTSKLPQFLNRV